MVERIAVLCGSCCCYTGTNAMDDLGVMVVLLLSGAGRWEWKVFLMNGLWVVGERLRLVEGCGRGVGVGVGGGPAVGLHLCLPRPQLRKLDNASTSTPIVRIVIMIGNIGIFSCRSRPIAIDSCSFGLGSVRWEPRHGWCGRPS